MSHGFVFRPGTMDEAMFHHIMAHDDYHLPERFDADDIIFDIGMHIGTFSYKALLRGSHHVHGFEVDPSNYECASRNLKDWGHRVQVHHRAMWRSDDRSVAPLYLTRSAEAANTGGGNVIWANEGTAVQPVALDEMIERVTAGGKKRIRLIKIDCEGSEFMILMTSQLLHLVDEIAGEYHEFGGQYDTNLIPERAKVSGCDRLTISELTDFLERTGFRVTSQRHGESNLGLFHAVNANANRVPAPAFLKVKGRLRSAWRGLKQTWAAR